MDTIDNAVLEDLKKRAKAASEKAYCPYSKFRVGAALITKKGDIFEGCNVENASYGLTICAERNAVFQMVSKGQQDIKAIVIYTPTQTATSPCGACRQVINEFGHQAKVLSICDGKDIIDLSLDNLLPNAFGPKNLSK